MSNYRKGANKERFVVNFLKEMGYVVIRASGSHGLFDVVAISPEEIKLIQVKSSVQKKNMRKVWDEIQIEVPDKTSIELWYWVSDTRKWYIYTEGGLESEYSKRSLYTSYGRRSTKSQKTTES